MLVVAVLGCRRESPEVPIPAGTFVSGGDDTWAGATTITRHGAVTRELPAFIVDRRLVRKDEYAECVAAGSCAHPGPDPFNRVPASPHHDAPEQFTTFDNAQAYCRWKGKRLLTQDEFERLARGRDGWASVCRPGPHLDCDEDVVSRDGVRQLAWEQWIDRRDETFPVGATMGAFGCGVCVGNDAFGSPLNEWPFRCARDAPPRGSASPPVGESDATSDAPAVADALGQPSTMCPDVHPAAGTSDDATERRAAQARAIARDEQDARPYPHPGQVAALARIYEEAQGALDAVTAEQAHAIDAAKREAMASSYLSRGRARGAAPEAALRALNETSVGLARLAAAPMRAVMPSAAAKPRGPDEASTTWAADEVEAIFESVARDSVDGLSAAHDGEVIDVAEAAIYVFAAQKEVLTAVHVKRREALLLAHAEQQARLRTDGQAALRAMTALRDALRSLIGEAYRLQLVQSRMAWMSTRSQGPLGQDRSRERVATDRSGVSSR